MAAPVHLTRDFYLAAFLVHKGASLVGIRRIGPKKVEFRFEAGEPLHGLLRLYWSGNIVPVVPGEMFLCLRKLKCLSIDRYEEPRDGETPAGGPDGSPDLPC